MKKTIILAALAALPLISFCQTKGNRVDDRQSLFEFQNCDKTLNGIHFTKMINNADKHVSEKGGVVTFSSPESCDIFVDPNGKLSQSTAKIIFTEVDNSKPFTFSAKLRPGFTKEGLYNAADLIVMANDTLWQKFCFEQDERGKHRVVTVRTVGTSDDNNHEVVEQDHIYYKISSDTKTIASYFSLDGKNWQMVRLYKNNYPKNLLLGICSQCPEKGECISKFSEIKLTHDNVSDFRLGD